MLIIRGQARKCVAPIIFGIILLLNYYVSETTMQIRTKQSLSQWINHVLHNTCILPYLDKWYIPRFSRSAQVQYIIN